jgi:hypothetical protein
MSTNNGNCSFTYECNTDATASLESRSSGAGLDIAMRNVTTSIVGTHTMRRTKASLIYRRTKNLRAVELLLGLRMGDQTEV